MPVITEMPSSKKNALLNVNIMMPGVAPITRRIPISFNLLDTFNVDRTKIPVRDRKAPIMPRYRIMVFKFLEVCSAFPNDIESW